MNKLTSNDYHLGHLEAFPFFFRYRLCICGYYSANTSPRPAFIAVLITRIHNMFSQYLIPLQLRSSGSNRHTSLGFITHLQEQANGQTDSQDEPQHKPEEQMELNRNVNLLAGLASILSVVDHGALAVEAIGGLAEDAHSMLTASIGVSLAVFLCCKAATGQWQGALLMSSRQERVGRRLFREQLGSLAGVGCYQEHGDGISLVDLLKLGKEGLKQE